MRNSKCGKSITFRPGLHDILLLFMPDRFHECGIKNDVYMRPVKQPSDTISCQNNFITSTIFVVFFAYLPRNRSIAFSFKPSYYLSEVWECFVLDYDAYT